MSLINQELTLPQSGITLKNRVAMSPMTTESAYHDGSVPEELISYYAKRSGQAGMIIVESCFVDSNGRGFDGALGIDSDDKIAGLSQLAYSIKSAGSKAVVQIYHAGRMAFPDMNRGMNPIGPSPVAALRPNAPVPTEMTDEEIKDMISSFAEATRRAIKAGFDGVELHGANTYLLQQFFSPHSNRRQDAWGGSLVKRMRFAKEVISAVKAVILEENKKDFILGYRFSPEELEIPGIRFDDTMAFLNEIALLGLDYVHFSMGSYTRSSIVEMLDTEMLISKYLEERSEALAEIPVMGVGGILQGKDAEKALSIGYDLVAVGKGFLLEPKWVEKASANEVIPAFADYQQREELVIPKPLWDFMDTTFNLVKDSQKELETQEKQKALLTREPQFVPGEYKVEAKGHNNNLPMVVSFSEHRIENITVDSSSESEGLSDLVFEKLPQQIISSQTLNVDAVSGASTTSKGLIDGVADAVKLAGNEEALDIIKARPKPLVEKSMEIVEEAVDLVVVGGGAAGIAAALRAEQEGQSVILIEKQSYIGGAISVSGGNQVVMGSKLQKQAGVTDDSPLIMAADFLKNGNNENIVELLALLAENVGQTTDWVHEYVGVEYDMTEGLHILAEYSKNRELAYAHGGHGFAAAVRKKMAESSVTLYLQTKATRLIAENGQVKGLVAIEENGKKHRIYSKAVILTTGGFGNNKALLGEELKDVLFYGTKSSMGEGLLMAQAPGINAATRMLDYGKIYPNGIEVSPGSAKSTIGGNIAVLRENALLVNTVGKRVVNERASNHDILKVLMNQESKMLYILMDQKHFDIFKEEVAEGGISQIDIDAWLEKNGSETPYFFHADTLDELARLAGMPENSLKDTVSRYNQFVKDGKDADFNRQAQFLQKEIGAGPYYLVEQKPRFATTMGGLVVNDNLSVINTDGHVIKGLYAAGEVVGGVMGTDSPSGANNAWALTSGKLAAEATKN
ncbi:NADH-dependent flavin oxidoreductase [Streptococcus thoraltensis]|uniref:NADH-dependent flavin oxidoreductase n=1 Tax=Streptococcus thoraltensis TaxID=55085 RepID=UPI0003788539|nr:NADH-dependent flavin oxidoreductase [Streptococcus thoraltensis]MDY4761616.1 FAD-dependent oxidoreductase [Streptococcus thoraltensis]